MDAKTFQATFGRTLTGDFFPENVSPLFFEVLMAYRHKTAQLVDATKRGLFYNNTERLDKHAIAGADYHNPLGLSFDVDPADIHAMLGLEGEVGEISEILLSTESDEAKRAKLVDESGDLLWYLALMFRSYGITFEEVFAGNDAKLRKRYPDQFTAELAVNRDLESEASVFNTIH